MRRSWMAVVALGAFAGCLLCARPAAFGRAAQEHPTRAVNIENYAFQPDPVTVAVGTTVVWTNRDEVAHNVVSRDRLFSSPDLEANQHFQFTFKKAGTFAYFCSIHPEMTGKVIVK